MSFITTNPLLAVEAGGSPPPPIPGTRALFPKSDGWYEMDSDGNIKKISDHAQLTNLEFEKSGHIGFQKEFTEAEQTWFDMIPSICNSAVNAETGLANEIVAREQKDAEIKATADEALAIAKGANQALTFDNYEAMWNCFVPLAQDSHRVGQNVLIRTLEVPDLWISEIMDSQADECISAEGLFCGDDAFVELLKTNGKIQISYYVFSALETQKVDLNEYATKEEVNTEQTAREEKDTELEENILSLTPKCVEEAQPGQVYLINNTHHIASVYPDPYNDFSVHFSKAITELEDCFECSLYIKPYAGEQVSYKDETGVIIYFGDDCSEAGEFTPQANTHYEISFKRLGTDDSSNPLIIARVGAWQ